MNIAVVGGTGLIGTRLVGRLAGIVAGGRRAVAVEGMW